MLPFGITQPKGRALRVLCLGAHADDIEIGCGGTILHLLRMRPRPDVRWVVWSANGVRANEARESARRFLGARAGAAVALHSFRDRFFPSEFQGLKEAFDQISRDFNPDIVFTHYRDDRHQDHRVVSDLTWNTFRDHVILEYEVPKWDGDLGTHRVFVPITKAQAARKIRTLLEVFESQAKHHWFDARTFQGLMRLRGIECKAPSGLAEAFYSRKVILTPVGERRRVK